MPERGKEPRLRVLPGGLKRPRRARRQRASSTKDTGRTPRIWPRFPGLEGIGAKDRRSKAELRRLVFGAVAERIGQPVSLVVPLIHKGSGPLGECAFCKKVLGQRSGFVGPSGVVCLECVTEGGRRVAAGESWPNG